MSKPSVSIPLESGEVEEVITLQEYANKLAAELHRVKSIIKDVSAEEIGARIEEVKISIAMYQRLFEILVTEHTTRQNISGTVEDAVVVDEPMVVDEPPILVTPIADMLD